MGERLLYKMVAIRGGWWLPLLWAAAEAQSWAKVAVYTWDASCDVPSYHGWLRTNAGGACTNVNYEGFTAQDCTGTRVFHALETYCDPTPFGSIKVLSYAYGNAGPSNGISNLEYVGSDANVNSCSSDYGTNSYMNMPYYDLSSCYRDGPNSYFVVQGCYNQGAGLRQGYWKLPYSDGACTSTAQPKCNYQGAPTDCMTSASALPASCTVYNEGSTSYPYERASTSYCSVNSAIRMPGVSGLLVVALIIGLVNMMGF